MPAPPPDEIIPHWLLDWIGPIAGAAVIGLWRMLVGKASREEVSNAVEKTTALVLERVDEHYEEAREHLDRLERKFDDLNKGLGATMVALSAMQGRFEEADKHRPQRR